MGIREAADRIAASQANRGGNYIKAGGRYLWEVLNIIYHTGNGGEFYIAELLCRESVATGEVGRDGKALVPTPVGSSASYCVNLSDPKQKSAGGNVKSLIMALFGVSEAEVTTDVIAETISETDKQGKVTRVTPCRGMLLRDEAWNKPQKANASKDFTHHRWTTVEQTEAEIKARVAELAKTNPI